jgi:excisionase family DNA binding protein
LTSQTTSHETPPVLTIPEAEKRARLGRTSLYQAMDEGKLPYLKWGRARRIKTADLDAFIDSLRHQ